MTTTTTTTDSVVSSFGVTRVDESTVFDAQRDGVIRYLRRLRRPMTMTAAAGGERKKKVVGWWVLGSDRESRYGNGRMGRLFHPPSRVSLLSFLSPSPLNRSFLRRYMYFQCMYHYLSICMVCTSTYYIVYEFYVHLILKFIAT